MLNAIYEEDFLGFSYGFRPGRGAHDALDALMVALKSRKVNFIFDADIRSFFDTVSQKWLIRFLEHRIGDKRIIRVFEVRSYAMARLSFWEAAIFDCGPLFGDFGEALVRMGWPPGALFDVPHDERPGGLVWFLEDKTVRALRLKRALTETGRLFDRKRTSEDFNATMEM